VTYVNIVSSSWRFQGIPLSKRLPSTSAPYNGELFTNDFQNYKNFKTLISNKLIN